MSTYLVAYVIGAYDYVETRDSNNVLIRVYTPVGDKERGLFALHVSFFCQRILFFSLINDRSRQRQRFYHSTRNILVLNIH
jgi:hypothetical protein